MSASKRDSDNETGGLLNRWIALLIFMCSYCYRVVPSLGQDSSKGGAVETGCTDLYDVIY